MKRHSKHSIFHTYIYKNNKAFTHEERERIAGKEWGRERKDSQEKRAFNRPRMDLIALTDEQVADLDLLSLQGVKKK